MLCLEETLGLPVTKDATYHEQSRRRREVLAEEILRQALGSAAFEIHELLAGQTLPPPVDGSRRCRECSLRDICQPELARAARRLMEFKAVLFEPEDETA